MTEPVPTALLNYRITASAFANEVIVGDEPSSFATHLPFEVRQGDLLIARVHATLFHVRTAERFDVPPSEVFDSVNQEAHELFCAIFDEEAGCIRGDLAEPSDFRDVLYIESVKVIPSRRGRKLALHIIERVRDMFGGGCAVLALKAIRSRSTSRSTPTRSITRSSPHRSRRRATRRRRSSEPTGASSASSGWTTPTSWCST